MPRLKPDTREARREHILDAAEVCFARSGFHRTTMHDICREASVSPGALYIHFASKEQLIAGIAERDRAKLAGELSEVAQAPDLIAALARLGEHYTVEQPRHKRVLFVEIGAESTRNEAVGAIFRAVDQDCNQSFASLFRRAAEEGRIAPRFDIGRIAQVLALIGDGLFWRRAVDPSFDANEVLPVITELVKSMIEPVEPAADMHNSGTPAPSKDEEPCV